VAESSKYAKRKKEKRSTNCPPNSPHQTARAIPAIAERITTAAEPALKPKRMDEAPLAPLKLPEMEADAALPLAVLEPDAPEAAELFPAEPVDVGAAGVVVTVWPKPEVVGGGVYLTVEVALEELLALLEADEPAEPEPEPEADAEADAELADEEELLVAAMPKEPLVA